MDLTTESRQIARRTSMTWGGLVLGWFVLLCVIPDPRPLGAPDWAVRLASLFSGASEPGARAVATIALRGVGLAALGVLVAVGLRGLRPSWAATWALVLSASLGVVAQWINYGYFPITPQLRLGLASTILGALAGMALRPSRVPLIALVLLVVGLFAWGTPSAIADDLYWAAQATGIHVLRQAPHIPDGDDGFASAMEVAFAFAEDQWYGPDPVRANRAAILSLAVILGDERVARVGKRRVDPARRPAAARLASRVTLTGQNDLSRHFWVSAGLVLLADERRTVTVGIMKELMDAAPGGSGFSFRDLAADRAGTLFAEAATRSPESALRMQQRIENGARIADFFPDVLDLPQYISRDEFQTVYGGVGGQGTRRIVDEIRRRLATCEGLR